jgi:hypothetical protein
MLSLRRFLLAVGILSFMVALAPLPRDAAIAHAKGIPTPTPTVTPLPVETPTP